MVQCNILHRSIDSKPVTGPETGAFPGAGPLFPGCIRRLIIPMALSDPTPRTLLHRRTVICQGYRRQDGLYDIEAHLEDTKTYPFSNRDRREVRPGEPVHGMWLRLTVDADLNVVDAEASTDYAPFRVCPRVTPKFRRLAGLTIGPGWMRAVNKRVGGVAGCTHLTELLGPAATTAYQTLAGQRRPDGADNGARRPFFLDSCHALKSDGEVVKTNWPAFYTGTNQP